MTLFEGYLAGMMGGFFGSLRDRRFAALSIFYLVVIVSAHYNLVGQDNYPMPSLLGPWFYLGAGIAQLIILASALFLWTRASMPLALLAYCAVIVNALAFRNYPSQAGIHNYYYALINTVQVLQIASLIGFSPGAEYLYKLVTGRITLKRNEGRWMQYRSN